jgi:hypothetical protein
MITSFLSLALLLGSLAAHREDPILRRHLDVALRDARHLNGEEQLLIELADIDRRAPITSSGVPESERILEQPVDLAPQSEHRRGRAHRGVYHI